MKGLNSLLYVVLIALGIVSCKKEETVSVLQNKYELISKEAEFTGEDFVVSLNATALQPREKGLWKIISGEMVKDFVFFENATSPYSKFKGMPGEEYVLEWTCTATDGSIKSVQTKIAIPFFNLEIQDQTPDEFQTVRMLFVDPKYRGKWSISPAYANLNSNYHDGFAEPPENKPSIELHGYANTNYTATFTFVYGGKTFKFDKLIKTGDYTQDEGLRILQLDRSSYRVISDNAGNVLELNLQASGIAWVLGQTNVYPSLRSFKKLRKLILGGSSLGRIPTILGEDFLELEELSMDRMGAVPVFPENFGNLVKLKSLVFSPLGSVDPNTVVVLPKSFANLKALESITFSYIGFVDFNGTLGALTNLKTLSTFMLAMPDDIGNLKQLTDLDIYCKRGGIPQSFSECSSLTFARMRFDDSISDELVLPTKIGDLKNLEILELTSQKLFNLPASFTELTRLKTLRLEAINLEKIPDSFGKLLALESLNIYGKFAKIPNSFGDLSKLSTLFISGAAQTLPDSFGNLSSLTYFNAESSALRTLPQSFGKLKKLRQIALRFSNIEELPSSFGDLDELESLDLSDTKLKSFPKSLLHLKSINRLILNNTNTGDIPEEISGMKKGVAIYMYQVPNLTLAHLNYILSISKNKGFYTNFGYFGS
ncbi:MAG: hypothetical protein EOO42_02060 [Flavobacteriales bacterium]|nr:MAG: hypothetical protein EOO42_02060 [Flavobacteriales bacterium]